ncbi:hypothetical protein D1007_39462 [Hordeum vulgare]|nr:hypothetical protein D1007_39462 [Hordeum vulgare]
MHRGLTNLDNTYEVKAAKKMKLVNNTVGEDAAEAAYPGGHLADAAYELGAIVDVHAGALVSHAVLLGGAGAGYGDPPLYRWEADALRSGRAPAASCRRGCLWRAKEVEDAVDCHDGRI